MKNPQRKIPIVHNKKSTNIKGIFFYVKGNVFYVVVNVMFNYQLTTYIKLFKLFSYEKPITFI